MRILILFFILLASTTLLAKENLQKWQTRTEMQRCVLSTYTPIRKVDKLGRAAPLGNVSINFYGIYKEQVKEHIEKTGQKEPLIGLTVYFTDMSMYVGGGL